MTETLVPYLGPYVLRIVPIGQKDHVLHRGMMEVTPSKSPPPTLSDLALVEKCRHLCNRPIGSQNSQQANMSHLVAVKKKQKKKNPQ